MLDLKSNFSCDEKFDFNNEVQLEFWPEVGPARKSGPSGESDLYESANTNKSEETNSFKEPIKLPESLKSLDCQALLKQIRLAAKTEQSLTLQVIELIAEIDRRKLYLDLGFGSIFEFVTKDLGYEPTSAMRRIQAARAISEMPELKAKIADRSLSLSVVSQAQSFLRKKANDQGKKISTEEKTELYKILENKSAREAEKELFKIAPELCLKSKEQEKILSENLTELRFVIDAETKAKTDELRLWLSHQNPDMAQAQFYKIMVEKLHRQLDPNKPAKPQFDFSPSITDAETDAAKKRSRHIPTAIKNLVWRRDLGCCRFVDAKSKKKCESKYQVQLDHIHPFRHMGEHRAENLRLYCGKHNRARD